MMVVFVTSSVCATDNGTWDSFLNRYIKDGLVDYHAVLQDDTLLQEYLVEIAAQDFSQLQEGELLAYLINGYNACTIDLIVKNSAPNNLVDSIKDIGGFFSSPWKKEICDLGGKKYTLDEIEHTLIRENFDDPRIHFALNCASMSCPPLAGFAYTGSELDSQLEGQTRAFVNDSNAIYFRDTKLYVSKIFDWYEDDFEHGVLVFLQQYAEGNLATRLKENPSQSISYTKYDWSLNKSSKKVEPKIKQ